LNLISAGIISLLEVFGLSGITYYSVTSLANQTEMFANAITWMSVPVCSLVNIGLGKECGSSAATASPAGGRAPAENSSTINHHDQQPKVNNHQHSTGLIGNGPESAYSHAVLSTAPCPAVGSSPQMATVSKSRPSSRRQSGAGGMSPLTHSPFLVLSHENDNYSPSV